MMAFALVACGDDDGTGTTDTGTTDTGTTDTGTTDTGTTDTGTTDTGAGDTGTDTGTDTDAATDSATDSAVAAPTCADYCTAFAAKCTGDNNDYTVSNEDCMTSCTTTFGWDAGMTGDTDGNTIGCRIYHAGVADNDVHCSHAGPYGANTCGTYCENYCSSFMSACGGTASAYADMATCMTTCGTFATDGAYSPLGGGNSVQCRSFWAGFPTRDPGGAGSTLADICKLAGPNSHMEEGGCSDEGPGDGPGDGPGAF